MNTKAIHQAVALVGTQSGLAKQLGVPRASVWQWMHIPQTLVPPKHCAKIESITNGQVSRQALRPDDWQDYWPELTKELTKEAADA